MVEMTIAYEETLEENNEENNEENSEEAFEENNKGEGSKYCNYC